MDNLAICLISFSVLDDEDNTITAGSIVTVTVSLKRENLLVKFSQEDFVDNGERDEELLADEEEEEKKTENVRHFCIIID